MASIQTDRHHLLKVSPLILLLLLAAFSFAGLWAQSGHAPASSLFFPRFISYQNVSSGIAIFNPSTGEAQAVLTLTDANGKTVASSSVKIPPLGQVAKTAADLFPAQASVDGALSITSSTSGLVAYYQTFDAGGTFLDGADSPESANELAFPIIPGPDEGASEIDLFNPNARPTAVELRLFSFGGDLLGKATVQVPAGGVYRGLSQDVFPSGTNFSGASHVIAETKPINIFSQAQSVAGTSLVAGFFSAASPGGKVDVAALNAQPFSRITNSGVIPHFHTGAQYASTLALASVEQAKVDVTVTVVANGGTSLETERITLGAMGGLRAPMQSIFSSLTLGEREGWILIQSSGRVSAAAIFGRSDGGALTVVPVQPVPQMDLIFPQVVLGSGSFTEIGLVNPGPATSLVDIYVVQPAGVTLASSRVAITPGSKFSQRLDQLMPEIATQVGGYIYVKATAPIFSTAFIWTNGGATVANFIPQALTSYYVPPDLKSFAVTGTVKLNDKPAPGFRVVLSGPVGKLATSTAEGLYVFTGLPAGRYSMSIDQFGFEFIPAQINFDITTASYRQDFQGYTAPNAIVVQPAALPVGSPDAAIAIFGQNFNSTSQAYVGLIRLTTTFVDAAHLNAVIPSYMMASPSQLDLCVITGDIASQEYPVMAFQDRPVLTSVSTPGDIIEGNSGTTLRACQ